MYQIDSTIKRVFCTSINKTELQERSISIYDDVKKAVFEVYRSPKIIARVMPGRTALFGDVCGLLDTIANRVFGYFNNEPNTALTQDNYDIFFYDLCEYFQNGYNALAQEAGIAEINFGVCQKLINMIFKYLSCYVDYSEYSDLFVYCHIPIDSFILNGFKSNGIVTVRYGAWSKLGRADYERLVGEYRASLSLLYPDFSFLHMEFYFWNCILAGDAYAEIVINPSPLLPMTKTDFYM